MHGADLQIIDADPRDPFHFFLANFKQQLVAGYSRTLPDGGLAAFMPDYDQVDREKAVAKEGRSGQPVVRPVQDWEAWRSSGR